jgi:transposase
MAKKEPAEKAVRDIRRKTRRRFSAEEKIRIVIEGLRGEESIASLCRREGIAANLYYRWSKEFLEAGKKRLVGDTQREATSTEVADLRKENARLKELVAQQLWPLALIAVASLTAAGWLFRNRLA